MRAARPAPLTLLATALASLVVVGVLFALYVLPAYAQDGSEPAKPTGLTGTATHGQVVLTWDDPQDDSITGYVILRRVRENDQGGEFNVLAANTGSAATTYTDDTVAASTAYTYRIRAINEHGVSERSGWFHIDTSPAPEPVNSPATGEPTISGTAQVGETLTANTSGPSPTGTDWMMCLSPTSGLRTTPKSREQRPTPPTPWPLTKKARSSRCRVSFTDDAGNAESLTSAATETVSAAVPRRSPANPTDPDVGGPGGPGQGAVYTYEDGDRTIRVILQGDLFVQETGADTPSDDVVRRTARGNIVRKQSGQGGADLPVFRSASGGALMTLPGGVLLALDPEWDGAMVNGFFARNNISKTRISELDYIPNGFFVRTEPGFPSLELANALAAQKGVVFSSPNWWSEVEAKQDPGEPQGGGGAAQEAEGIEPRNESFDQAYDLPLGSGFGGMIDPANDIDYFKLDLSDQPGDTDVLIYTTNRTSDFVDTVGKLYDANKVLLQENDDDGTGNHFRMLERLSSDVYYVTVEGYESATGGYVLYAKAVLSLGSSVAGSIDSIGEAQGYILDLSEQSGSSDVSLFTVSDNQSFRFSGDFDVTWVTLRNTDALGDKKIIQHLFARRVPAGFRNLTVTSQSGETGDYSLHFATVPDQSLRIGTATTLSLDAPTSGKLSSGSVAHYFKLVLADAKDLSIMAFSDVNAVMLNSGGTEIPVNIDIGDGYNNINDDVAPGTYYVKITAPDASIVSPVYYALYAYEDTGYGQWVDGCADDTDDLDISTINDPLYACQWHLNSADSSDMDINVESVWADSITGAGVNVAVVDETIDYSHADLKANINGSLNHDYGGRSNAYRPADHHGTNVAGVIAARDNTMGVRGVAPSATIYGYNLIGDDGANFTTVNKADAMARNRASTAVSNNSWGPPDGLGLDLAPAVWETAIDSGVTQGYAGKGVFYAWASGNGHERGDNSNFDEFVNYYGVTAVCAVGDDGARAAYSEEGANLWVCAPSSGGDRGIVTTDNSDRYTNTFGGTSSATPKVSGVAALLRDANPDLTWRDLKLILAASARQNDASNSGWEEGARKYGATDGADRYHFNHEYGFGVVSAAAAIALARDWNTLPEFQECIIGIGHAQPHNPR